MLRSRARVAAMARCPGTMRIGDHLRATRVFVRRAPTGRYFYRVPSRLPATDDGSGTPLAGELDSAAADGRERTGIAPGTVRGRFAGDDTVAFATDNSAPFTGDDSAAADSGSTVRADGAAEADEAA